MGKRIAIVGAGVSGLAAAWSLRETGADVTIFEKSRGLSGRAASRTRHGVRFDHGANYFKTDSDAVAELILERLPAGGLVQIEKDVWTFDIGGTLSPGDPEINAEAKWTYRSGISTLGKLLAAAANADIRHQVRIFRLIEKGESWQLVSDAKENLGIFDGVLITTPGPQSIEILENSQLPSGLGAALTGALGKAAYHCQFSVVLAVSGEIERPGDFFALVNADRKHDIAWLSFENDKPGRVPPGQTVMVVQLSPDLSAAQFEEPPERVIAGATEKAAQLLRCDLPVEWADIQRWKFAHPFSAADSRELAAGESSGLFFAGDALVGKGRVPRALETGLDAARRIRQHLPI